MNTTKTSLKTNGKKPAKKDEVERIKQTLQNVCIKRKK
jgi:hypothetical protein